MLLGVSPRRAATVGVLGRRAGEREAGARAASIVPLLSRAIRLLVWYASRISLASSLSTGDIEFIKVGKIKSTRATKFYFCRFRR